MLHVMAIIPGPILYSWSTKLLVSKFAAIFQLQFGNYVNNKVNKIHHYKGSR